MPVMSSTQLHAAFAMRLQARLSIGCLLGSAVSITRIPAKPATTAERHMVQYAHKDTCAYVCAVHRTKSAVRLPNSVPAAEEYCKHLRMPVLRRLVHTGTHLWLRQGLCAAAQPGDPSCDHTAHVPYKNHNRKVKQCRHCCTGGCCDFIAS
jgi:hypothetical protein